MSVDALVSILARLNVSYEIVTDHGYTQPNAEWDMPHYAYTVKVSRGEHEIVTPFRCGTGWDKRPELTDVLPCLISDAHSGAEDFESFCDSFGYDSDSRRAHAVWEACKRNAEQIGRMFDSDEIEEISRACADI